MNLLSLASRQIWPQVLAVLHARPSRVVLFHSREHAESWRPAQRLQSFFASGALGDATPAHVDLREVPHDRFDDIVEAFATLAESDQLDTDNCQVHLSGGNKLMAMAAAEWCRRAGIPCFYLERNLRVFPFLPVDPDLRPQPDFPLDRHLARNIEPLALLRCQIDASEIVNPGQRLVLSQAGIRSPENEFPHLLKKDHDFQRFLTLDHVDPESRAGDPLEYAAAFALLKLGVPVVQRGIRLVPRVLRSSGREEGELDLVFNWSGKLWVVDCKDRHGADTRIDNLRGELLSMGQLTPTVARYLDEIAGHLRERDLIPLKEDLLVASEAAGLLGRALCVRREPPPPQAVDFAASRGLTFIHKDRLMAELRSILHPA